MSLLTAFFGIVSAARPAVGAPDATAWQLELLAQHGGALQTVALDADHAYVGMGSGIAVVDISLPGQPVLVGRSVALSGTVQAITVRDRVAYVGVADLAQPASVVDGAAGRDVGRIYVFDVVDPNRPILRQAVDVPGAVSELRLRENRIYAAAGFAGVCGFEILVDRQIFPTGCLQLWEPRSLWASVGVGFPAQSLDVDGTLVYVAAGGDLWTLGAQDARAMRVLAHFTDSPNDDEVLAVRRLANSVVTIGDRGAYLIEPDTGETLDLVRIDSPAALEVRGQFAYVVSGRLERRSLSIIDWELLVGSRMAGTVRLQDGTSSAGLAASVGMVAVTGGAYSMELVDISQPASPVAGSGLSAVATGDLLAIEDGHAYLFDGVQFVRVLNVTDPLAPRPVGRFSIAGGDWGRVFAMAVHQSRGYLAFLTGGIVILELKDPARPIVLSSDQARGLWTVDIAAAGDRLYVLDQRGQLVILDASHDDSLPEFGRVALGLPDPLFGGRLLVHGGLVFVSAGVGSDDDQSSAGVRIVDVRDPVSPRVIGSFAVDGTALQMTATDATLYVAGGFAGIHTVDVTDPTQPHLVSTTQLPGRVISVLMKGHLLLASESAGRHPQLGIDVGDSGAVTVFDTSIDATPTQLGRVRTPARAAGRLHLLQEPDRPRGAFHFLSSCWQASICVWGVNSADAPPHQGRQPVYLPFAFRGASRTHVFTAAEYVGSLPK